jgi:Zn-dependent protease with chaperone function
MSRHTHVRLLCILVCCALGTGSAHAQFSLKDLTDRLQSAGNPSPRPAADPQAIAKASPVKANPAVASEMAPDINCSRPRERFNVAQKIVDFGGQAATLRMERMLASDFAFTDLKPEDKEMLRYIAQTTVWVPAEVESKLGGLYETGGGLLGFGRAKPTDDEQSALDAIEARLNKLRTAVSDYPAEIYLRLDKTLADGAFARFGGLILLSPRFLNSLEDTDQGASFLLAHEVSHVYKRHALKRIQFLLISSDEGWSLTKDLLGRAMRGSELSVKDAIFAVTTVPKLLDFVRGVQISFGKDQELEADACSVVWLQAIQVPPAQAWSAYKSVLGESSSYATEHPTSAERERRFLGKAGKSGDASQQVNLNKGSVKAGGQALIKESSNPKPNR